METTRKSVGLSTETGDTVPLKAVEVNVTIYGFVARVDTKLLYSNKLSDPVEAKFTFPVDDRSAVFKFEASIEGRNIVAECQEREQALLTYQDAIDHGSIALMLKEDDVASDVFECTLGNLPPECDAELTLAYVIELPVEYDGKLRFTLPTILNPRYSPEGCQEAAADAVLVKPPKVPYTLTLSGRIHSSQRVLSVTSAKDKLSVQMTDDGHTAEVQLAEEFSFDHDLSFLVEYEHCYEPQAVLEAGDPEADGLLKEDILMLNFKPELKEVPMATCGEFIFIIDRSGSMTGDNIENAREALLLFLKSLPAGCYFNVVSFGSKYSSLFRNSQPYTAKTLRKATALQRKMGADMGGTEILKPLNLVLTKKPIAGHPRLVFLITDGQVGNSQQVIDNVRCHVKNSRVYTLGIGEGVSTSLIKGVARVGNGRADFISQTDRLQPKVIALLKQAMQPAVLGVEYVWDIPPDITMVMIPEKPVTNILPGEILTMYAVAKNVDKETIYAESSLTVKGILDNKPVEFQVTFTFSDESKMQTGPVFHHLAAKGQIKQLEESAPAYEDIVSDREKLQHQESLQAQIVLVSRSANVLSKYTTFVAVDTERKERVQGSLVRQPCPVPTATPEFMDASTRQNLKCCGLVDGGFDGGGGGDEAMTFARDMPMSDSDADDEAGENEALLLKQKSSPKHPPNRNRRKLRQRMNQPAGSALLSCLGLKKKPISQVTGNDMMEMVSLQGLHGNWDLTDELAVLLNVQIEVLRTDDLVKDVCVLATVAAVAWLRTNYRPWKTEWEIVETKALAWLNGQNLSGKGEETLIEEFTSKYKKDMLIPEDSE